MLIGKLQHVSLVSVSVLSFFDDVIILCNFLNEIHNRLVASLAYLVSMSCFYVNKSITIIRFLVGNKTFT